MSPNAVLQLSSKVLGKRAENVIKDYFSSLYCVPDIEITLPNRSTLEIKDMVFYLSLASGIFAKNSKNEECLVLAFKMHCNIADDSNMGGDSGSGDTGSEDSDVTDSLTDKPPPRIGYSHEVICELWMKMRAGVVPGSTGKLTIVLFAEYDHIEITCEDPFPGLQEELDIRFRSHFEPGLRDQELVRIPLYCLFSENMELESETPSIDLVGVVTFSGRRFYQTLAIQLRISEGTEAPVLYSQLSGYTTNLLASGDDWALQIDPRLMAMKIQEEYEKFNLQRIFNGGYSTNNMVSCWSGQDCNWVDDSIYGHPYIEEHFADHPVWLGARGLRTLWEQVWSHEHEEYFDRPYTGEIVISAFADIKIVDERFYLDAHIFNIWMQRGNIIPIEHYQDDEEDAEQMTRQIREFNEVLSLPIGSARLLYSSGNLDDVSKFLVTRTRFSTESCTVYGVDEEERTSWSWPKIDVPYDVRVEYLAVVGHMDEDSLWSPCFLHNIGELENGAVLSHFDIKGGDGLKVCSVEVKDDPQGVFEIRLPEAVHLPFSPDRDGTTVDVLMRVPGSDFEGPQMDPYNFYGQSRRRFSGTIEIKSNDFILPRATIRLWGRKDKEVPPGLPVPCLPLIPWEKMTEILHEEIFTRNPPRIDPPIIPHQDFYLAFDVIIVMPPQRPPRPDPKLYFEVLDSSGHVIERSRRINNSYCFTVPLDPEHPSRIIMHPEKIEQEGIMRLSLSRVIRVGEYKSKDRILQLAGEEESVFALTEEGVDVVSLANPSALITKIKVNDAQSISSHDDHLYVLTKKHLEIFDISNLKKPFVSHRLPVGKDAGFHLKGDQFVLYDTKRLQVYELVRGIGLKLLSEFKPKEQIKVFEMIGDAYVLVVKGNAYIFKSLTDAELTSAKRVKMEDAKRLYPRLTEERTDVQREEEEIPLNGYLVRVFDDRKGFSIIRKEPVSYRFSKELQEHLISLRK